MADTPKPDRTDIPEGPVTRDVDDAGLPRAADGPLAADLVDPVPDGPNEDHANLADPPPEVEMDRTSDDNDLNPTGGGLTDTPLREEYENIALRDDLARRLEDLVADAQEWARQEGSDEARGIASDLADIYERLGVPTEETDGPAR